MWWLAAICICTGPTLASTPGPVHPPDGVALVAADIGIQGLMVDRTITKGGHDFYDAFVQHLGLQADLPYTLTVSETAGIGRSTFVMVDIEDTLVFRSRLNPLPEQIDILARQAAVQVTRVLIERALNLQELEYY